MRDSGRRAINRTLILPEFTCWCDQDNVPTVLKACTTEGSDLELPFSCPSDVFLPIRKLDNSGLPYRQTGFLSVYEQVRHQAACAGLRA